MTHDSAPWWQRIARSPSGYVVSLVILTTVGLGLDQLVELPGQLVLSACVTAVFLFMLTQVTLEQRITALLVVLIATCGEYVGSVLWGAYTYRLENLPLFVPPGHGLVFLAGLRISQSTLVHTHRRAFLAVTASVAIGWGLLGLSGVLGRYDVAGAIGVAVWCAALRWGPNPTIYAGVFWFVAYLEIYGTAIGTWRWAEELPGLGIPDGNPPSGAVAGYVGFDLFALYFMPKVMAWLERRRPPAEQADELLLVQDRET